MLERLETYCCQKGLVRTSVIQQAIADFLDQKDAQQALMTKMGENFAKHIPELDSMLKELDPA